MTMQSSFWETYGTAFRQTYERAYQEVSEREKQKKKAHQQKDLHFLRANLSHFCPDVPTERHEAIYFRLLTNHWLSARSFRYVDFGSLAHMGINGDTDFLKLTDAPRPSRIFCTYHLGGYRAVLAMLLNAGYPLTLVIDNRTLKSQKEYIENISAQLNQYNQASASIDMLDAESPAIGRQMAGALHKGRSILIFLDGNTGVGGIYQRNNRQLRVSFLNKTIVSRSGIATLAHATRTPIIPIISYYKTVDGVEIPYYDCLPAIEPKAVPAEVFVRETTQQLYDLLADYVRRYVDQWESWFYFHKFLDFDALTATSSDDEPVVDAPVTAFRFNEERYSLFKIEQTSYLFDRQTYQAFPLTDDAFDWLHQLEQSSDSTSAEGDSTSDGAFIDHWWSQGVLQSAE
jgi:lauroyl/myristoyl acyltransferase